MRNEKQTVTFILPALTLDQLTNIRTLNLHGSKLYSVAVPPKDREGSETKIHQSLVRVKEIGFSTYKGFTRDTDVNVKQ